MRRLHRLTRPLALMTFGGMIVLLGHASAPGEAAAATSSFMAVARMSAPVLSAIEAERASPSLQQESEQREPPPFTDPASGAVFSILGGSVFSGSSAFQTGAAFAYFFGEKASFGFELEGDLTFGPGGRVVQMMGSFVYQAGARGYLRATSSLPAERQAVLDELGIVPEPETEQAPFVQFGGGLRFYVKPNLAFRADVRFAQVFLDLRVVGRSNYPMRRIAGMVSWDF